MQASLLDLLEQTPEEPEKAPTPPPPRQPEPPQNNHPEVQRRIDALVRCRRCDRKTSPEWAAFSGGVCLVCSPLESEQWLAERRKARSDTR